MDQYSVAKVIHLSALLGTKDDPHPIHTKAEIYNGYLLSKM